MGLMSYVKMVTQLPGIILLGSGKRKKTRGRKIAEKALVPLLATAGILGGILLAPAIAPVVAGIGGRQLLKKGAVAVGRSAFGVVKKRPLTSLVVGGILTSSPKAREFVVKAPGRIFTGGQKIGKIIEDPTKAEDVLGIREEKTLGGKIIGGLKTAGLIGAGVAGVVGAKKLLELRKDKLPTAPLLSTPALRQLGFTEPRPVGVGGVPITVAPAPVGAPGEPLTRQMPGTGTIIQISI